MAIDYEGALTAPGNELASVESVQNTLDRNLENGKLRQTIRNFECVLEQDPRFAGKIRYDDFSRQIFLTGSVPWETERNYRPWGSNDDSACFAIIQSAYGLNDRQNYYDAIKNVANRNHFHQVTSYLETLPFKGTGYVRRLLPDLLGAEDTEYNRCVIWLAMLGAVYRVYEPGTKYDYCPILEGRQGLGKSTFLRLLSLNDLWFSDSLDSLDGKTAAELLTGCWICELAELKSLFRTAGGPESVKRFLSATSDRYRLPYERRADTFFRQTTFWGTTNRSDYLTDETGNRRFYIIQTGVQEPKISLFDEEQVMPLILGAWAEVVKVYKEQRPKLVLPEAVMETARELQQAAQMDDWRKGKIEDFLKHMERTCVLEVWQDCLEMPDKPQKWQSAEIAQLILNVEGWVKNTSPTKYGKYGTQRIFEKMPTGNATNHATKCATKSATTTDFVAKTEGFEDLGSETSPFDN